MLLFYMEGEIDTLRPTVYNVVCRTPEIQTQLVGCFVVSLSCVVCYSLIETNNTLIYLKLSRLELLYMNIQFATAPQ